MQQYYCARYLGAHLLFLDHLTPTPDEDWGSLDAFNLIRMFRELGWHVSFWPWEAPLHSRSYGKAKHTRDLQRLGVECLYEPWVRLEDWLRQHGEDLSLIFVSRVGVASTAIPLVKKYAPQAKMVFRTVDLHFLRESREAQLRGSEELSLSAERTRNSELDCIRRSDATIVVSAVEQDLLQNLVPETLIAHLPLPCDIPGRSGDLADRRDIVFLGGYNHTPNVDAVEHFVSDIWPLIRTRIPEARFIVAGSNLPERLRKLVGNGVVVLGYVEDLNTLFRACRVSVAPLRWGAGQKGKIVTSLSYGVPVVATEIAAESMGLLHEQTAMIAEDAQLFADCVCRLMVDDVLWLRLSDDGLKHVSAVFSYASVKKRLGALLDSLGFVVPEQRSVYMGDVISVGNELVRDGARCEEGAFPLPECCLGPSYIVKAFRGIDDFRAWSAENSWIHECERAKEIVDHVRAHGITGAWLGHVSADRVHCDDLNYRESLLVDGLNPRQRAVLDLLTVLPAARNPRYTLIYAAEGVTTFAGCLSERFPKFIGSEYAPTEAEQRKIWPVQHQDLAHLTMSDASFEVIICNEVFEHLPDLHGSLRELARVLKPGGTLVATFPFLPFREKSIEKAHVQPDGTTEYFTTPEYHGNPIDPKGGSLVYRIFGWDILECALEVGFQHCEIVMISSIKAGITGADSAAIYVLLAHRGPHVRVDS